MAANNDVKGVVNLAYTSNEDHTGKEEYVLLYRLLYKCFVVVRITKLLISFGRKAYVRRGGVVIRERCLSSCGAPSNMYHSFYERPELNIQHGQERNEDSLIRPARKERCRHVVGLCMRV